MDVHPIKNDIFIGFDPSPDIPITAAFVQYFVVFPAGLVHHNDESHGRMAAQLVGCIEGIPGKHMPNSWQISHGFLSHQQDLGNKNGETNPKSSQNMIF
jgi:hypothetical protein